MRNTTKTLALVSNDEWEDEMAFILLIGSVIRYFVALAFIDDLLSLANTRNSQVDSVLIL